MDLKTGAVLWTHDFLGDAPKDPPGFDGTSARVLDHKARPGTPSCDGETVIFPVFDQCRIVALDARSGKRRWDFKTQGWTYGRPAITDRQVFVGSQDEHFYGVDKETGRLVWKFKTGSRIEASCAASGGFVYVGSCDGNLYCLRQDDGALEWKFATDKRKDFGSPIYAQPVVSGNTVYLAAMEGQVYAVSADTGKLKWRLRPSESSEIDGSFTDGKRWFVTTRRTNDAAGENAAVCTGARTSRPRGMIAIASGRCHPNRLGAITHEDSRIDPEAPARLSAFAPRKHVFVSTPAELDVLSRSESRHCRCETACSGLPGRVLCEFFGFGLRA